MTLNVGICYHLLLQGSECYEVGGSMSHSRSKDGFVVITIVLAMGILMGFAGLAIDVGFFRYVKRTAQNAADAGAVGAAMAKGAGESAVTHGRADAARNGFTHGTDGVTVSVNSPPSTGAFTGNSGYVEVVVSQPSPTLFMNALGIDSATVTARAVSYVQESGSGCVYVLSPDAKLAFTVTGSSSVTVNCGIYVNSNNANDAFNVSTGSCVSATEIAVVGGVDDQSGGCVTPTPVPMDYAQPDPLAGIPEPTVGPCDYVGLQTAPKDATTTFNPGVYCGGIKVGGSTAVGIFNPGEYILVGGSLLISGGANAYGDGVTFFNTYNASYGYKPYYVTGGSSTVFKAPTDSSNPRVGMLFMTDRSIVDTKSNQIGGHSSMIIDGTIYMPGVNLTYNGGSTGTGNYTLIVSNTLNIEGGATINSNYGGLPGGESIIRVGVLVE